MTFRPTPTHPPARSAREEWDEAADEVLEAEEEEDWWRVSGKHLPHFNLERNVLASSAEKYLCSVVSLPKRHPQRVRQDLGC